MPWFLLFLCVLCAYGAGVVFHLRQDHCPGRDTRVAGEVLALIALVAFSGSALGFLSGGLPWTR